VVAISAGLLLTISVGLWLVHNAGYGYGDTWIVVSLVLWFLSGFLGDRGGRIQRETRALAERLAGAGDLPSPELRARARNPVALPAWVLMRFAGQWIDSREDLSGSPTWEGIGFLVADAGLILLLVTTALGWWSIRKPERRWPAQTVTVLAAVYVVALLVAMFAMSGKPGS